MTGCHDTNIHAAMTVLHREPTLGNTSQLATRRGEHPLRSRSGATITRDDIKVSDKAGP